MERSPLYDLAKAVPFRPFTVTMASGRHVNVAGPEMILLGRRRDVVSFVDEEGYDRLVIIEHGQINTVDLYDPNQSPPPVTPPDVAL